ncbi:SGNH/GDSL hydrolase family protein [Croceitalea marina]|uniref:SGNH/GDSL hydrolase family protein n=1 Tax=Croceitalea marina TaxID=1775166 RepID=A0ABW5MX88_9FLAO
MLLKRRFFLLFLLISNFQLSIASKALFVDNPYQNLKVLFIGNSLTYTNNLPELVKKEALLQDIRLEMTMIAYPNYALIDHLNDGDIQKLIAENNYDFVVVQQGPSSQAEGKKMLLEDGAKIKKLCQDNGAEMVYFMVWPSKQYYYTYDDVIKNHIHAATSNEALLAPVGAIWKMHFDKTNDYSYYGADGFHPSLIGSKIAAKVISKTICKQSAIYGNKD